MSATDGQGGDAGASSPERERDLRGQEIIRNHMLAAMGLGLIPLPLADAIAITGVQVKMLRDLARLYEIELASTQLFYSLVGSLTAGLGLPIILAPAVFSAFKLIPGLGTVGGAVSLSLVSGATTYALGKVFSQHFESGGTLLTFNASKVRSEFRRHYDEGLKTAGEMKAAHDSSETARGASASGRGRPSGRE